MNPNPWFDENPKFRSLYLNNAWFKAACDSLIPVLLEGLAAHADKMQEERQRLLRELRGVNSNFSMAVGDEKFRERIKQRFEEGEDA